MKDWRDLHKTKGLMLRIPHHTRQANQDMRLRLESPSFLEGYSKQLHPLYRYVLQDTCYPPTCYEQERLHLHNTLQMIDDTPHSSTIRYEGVPGETIPTGNSCQMSPLYCSYMIGGWVVGGWVVGGSVSICSQSSFVQPHKGTTIITIITISNKRFILLHIIIFLKILSHKQI